MSRPTDPADWERDAARAAMAVHAGCGGDIVQAGIYRRPRLTLSVVCAKCSQRWTRPDARHRFRLAESLTDGETMP